MTDVLRQLLRVGQMQTIHLRRSYDSPVRTVWDAITDPDRVARWFGTVSGDLRVGGELSLAMTPDDVVASTILACEPPRYFELSWQWPGEAASALRLQLEEADGRTVLDLQHMAQPVRRAGAMGEGWEDFLRALGDEAAGKPAQACKWDDVRKELAPLWADAATNAVVDDRFGTFTSSEPGAAYVGVRFERRYDTSPQDLWQAVTDPRRLGRWFARVDGDLREGGAFAIDFNGDITAGAVQRCEPPTSLRVTWEFEAEGTSEVRVEIRPDGATSVLVLEHARLPRSAAAGYGAGWQAYMDSLQALLTGAGAVNWTARWEGLMPMYRAMLDDVNS